MSTRRLLLVAALQGCATGVAPALQTIRVQTPGCSLAHCELSNDRGVWHVSPTPGSAVVAVSRQPLRVSCRADDAASTQAMARSSRPPTSGTGALTGGVAGGAATGVALGATVLSFIPALGVITVLTGASVGATVGEAAQSHQQPLRYTDSVSIPMKCAAAPQRPSLGLGIRGMTVAESAAAGLVGRTAVRVIAVAPEGRAAASGLRVGDVILALNGQDLGDAADLEEGVLAWPDEAPLALRVWRDQRTVDLRLSRATTAPP